MPDFASTVEIEKKCYSFGALLAGPHRKLPNSRLKNDPAFLIVGQWCKTGPKRTFNQCRVLRILYTVILCIDHMSYPNPPFTPSPHPSWTTTEPIVLDNIVKYVGTTGT
jgi:hypothetical protein